MWQNSAKWKLHPQLQIKNVEHLHLAVYPKTDKTDPVDFFAKSE